MDQRESAQNQRNCKATQVEENLIGLVELEAIEKLAPFFRCPKENATLTIKTSCKGRHSVCIDMTCTACNTKYHWEGGNMNSQMIFACTYAAIPVDTYEALCRGSHLEGAPLRPTETIIMIY